MRNLGRLGNGPAQSFFSLGLDNVPSMPYIGIMEKDTAPKTNTGTKEDTMFSFISSTLQIDEIEWHEQQNAKRFTVEVDGHGSYCWITDFDVASKTGLCRSSRTGRLLAFEITGRTSQRGMVRVALWSLKDISLRKGTLRADEKITGGAVNDIFLLDPESARWNMTP